MFNGRIYVPTESELKKIIMQETHNVPYVGHPGYQNTLTTIKKSFYWLGMKKEVAMYIARCLVCQNVKVECKHPVGLLHQLPIPEWKWDLVTIYYMTKLPRIEKKHDSVMVVVDKLTKSTHFVIVQAIFKAAKIAEVYMKEIAKRHGNLRK